VYKLIKVKVWERNIHKVSCLLTIFAG